MFLVKVGKQIFFPPLLLHLILMPSFDTPFPAQEGVESKRQRKTVVNAELRTGPSLMYKLGTLPFP